VQDPLDARIVEQRLIELGSRQRGREEVVRASADAIGDQAGDLVGLVPLLGLVVAAHGGGDDDAGQRSEFVLRDLVDSPARRHQQHVTG
jgi:hypothetical protein